MMEVWSCGSCSESRHGRGDPDAGASLTEGSPGLVMLRNASAASSGQNPGMEGPYTQAVLLGALDSISAAFLGLWVVALTGSA